MIRNAEQTDTFRYDYETYETPVSRYTGDVDISFVIPVFNEEDSLEELTQRIDANVPTGMNFEIIFIDDGSMDDSWAVIQALSDVTRGAVQGSNSVRTVVKLRACKPGLMQQQAISFSPWTQTCRMTHRRSRLSWPS